MRHEDIEKILVSIVRRLYGEYPDVEWDDLVAQGWLIVTEWIDKWDSERASLATYLYPKIEGELRKYIQRDVLKELNMNGRREHAEYLEATYDDTALAVEAKVDLESMIEGEDGTAKEILVAMAMGLTQTEAAESLGVSKQRVSAVLQRVRDKYKED